MEANNLSYIKKLCSLPKESTTLYFRPETGVFVNFMTGQKSPRRAVFSNEIIARQFIFIMRELEQMEMVFSSENYRVSKQTKLAHYANAAYDIEFRFTFGFREIEGIHSRTYFYLKNKSYITYVIETSLGSWKCSNYQNLSRQLYYPCLKNFLSDKESIGTPLCFTIEGYQSLCKYKDITVIITGAGKKAFWRRPQEHVV